VNLPHQAAIDANDMVYVVDRENKRIQVFDQDLNYQREFANPGWNPWDIAISRKGDDGFAYIADSRRRARAQDLARGRQGARDVGLAGPRRTASSTGSTAWRWTRRRGLRGRYVRAAHPEVRAGAASTTP
jgi:hypothetical protein